MNHPTPPEAAQDLLLELVRAPVEARTCPGCGQTLQDCRLSLARVELDRVLVEVACESCGRGLTFAVTPSADEGTVSIQ